VHSARLPKSLCGFVVAMIGDGDHGARVEKTLRDRSADPASPARNDDVLIIE
jgi:hypothetical protein